MEKLSLEKFANKQIQMESISGGNVFLPGDIPTFGTSETVYANDHTTGTGEGGCGIDHSSGCLLVLVA